MFTIYWSETNFVRYCVVYKQVQKSIIVEDCTHLLFLYVSIYVFLFGHTYAAHLIFHCWNFNISLTLCPELWLQASFRTIFKHQSASLVILFSRKWLGQRWGDLKNDGTLLRMVELVDGWGRMAVLIGNGRWVNGDDCLVGGLKLCQFEILRGCSTQFWWCLDRVDCLRRIRAMKWWKEKCTEKITMRRKLAFGWYPGFFYAPNNWFERKRLSALSSRHVILF